MDYLWFSKKAFEKAAFQGELPDMGVKTIAVDLPRLPFFIGQVGNKHYIYSEWRTNDSVPDRFSDFTLAAQGEAVCIVAKVGSIVNPGHQYAAARGLPPDPWALFATAENYTDELGEIAKQMKEKRRPPGGFDDLSSERKQTGLNP